MSRLIYGLSGEGRGHTSRALAVVSELRRRGHEVRFCCGGVARAVLEGRGESVIPVPPLEHVLEGNQLRLWRTARRIGPELLRAGSIVNRLCDEFVDYDPDLLIADFETFSTWAAERMGIPVLSLNHQQIITEAEYRSRPREWLDTIVAQLATRFIAPRHPARVLITSFYDLPLKHPDRTTLIPPVLRSDVLDLNPANQGHLLVYYNHGEGADAVLRALKAARQRALVYGFPDELIPEHDAHLTVRPPSRDGFLEDLATSRAVVSTAGFTLMSEALYLGKPILAVPNGGIFEQKLNARFLDRLGLGERVDQEDVTADVLRAFLSRAEQYRASRSAQVECGTQDAADHVEDVLRETAPDAPSAHRASAHRFKNLSG